MAGSALERAANTTIHANIALPSPEHRTIHSQAARFARVTVAQMQLLKPALCRSALENGNLYLLLHKEIDKARETYQKQFMTIPSMADYLHQELVSSVFGGDATKLGADYPGELS